MRWNWVVVILALTACGAESETPTEAPAPTTPYIEQARAVLESDPTEAVRLAELGVEADEPDAHAVLGLARMENGNAAGAIAPLEIAHRERPDDVWEPLAQAYLEADRVDDAVAIYDAALADSRDVMARARLSKARVLLPSVEAAATAAVAIAQTRASRRETEPDLDPLYADLQTILDLLREELPDGTDQVRSLDRRWSDVRDELGRYYGLGFRLVTWDTDGSVPDDKVALAVAPVGQEESIEPCFPRSYELQRVEASVSVSGDGSVSEIEAQGPSEVAECVERALRTRAFPRDGTAYVVSAVYERAADPRRRRNPGRMPVNPSPW